MIDGRPLQVAADWEAVQRRWLSFDQPGVLSLRHAVATGRTCAISRSCAGPPGRVLTVASWRSIVVP
jgi:hypothetical protein